MVGICDMNADAQNGSSAWYLGNQLLVQCTIWIR